jgi:hypothetical protein
LQLKEAKKAKSRRESTFFSAASNSSLTFRTQTFTQNKTHSPNNISLLKQQQKSEREGGGGEMETQQLLLVGRRAFCGAPSFKKGTKLGDNFFFFFSLFFVVEGLKSSFF